MADMISAPDPEISDDTLNDEEFGDDTKATGPLMEDIPEGEEGRRIERKIAKLAMKIWESKDPILDRVECQWKVNKARRVGISNAKVVYDTIDQHWTAHFPTNASPDTTPSVNKAATLCRRFASLMFADPPAPDVVPPSGDDEDIAASEFSERALIDLQGESHLNEAEKARKAFDRASTFGSGYVRYYIDARGGGLVPVQVQAHPDATHVDNALIDPSTMQIDPATVEYDANGFEIPGTGQPIPGTGEERGPYEQRFVRSDGTLTDDKSEAAKRWAPEIKSEVLDGRHVRLIPHTADDIWDAYGAQVASMSLTWGELKQIAPEISKLDKEDKKKILEYRPKKSDDLIPGGKSMDVEAEKNEDERLVFVLTTYYKQCEDYPQGLYLITIADRFVLHRSEWVAEGENGPEPLDIPITQYSQFTEGRDGYWKVGLMEIVGGGNEYRASQIANWLDHLEKLNNRKTFLPTNSIIRPEDLALPRDTALPMNPGGEPKYEDVPGYPSDSYNMLEFAGGEMDDASGLLDTARESSQADSGRQAFAIISQVHAGLSEPRQGVERAYIRGSRITLQLARAFFDVPRELRWSGEDGKYRHKAWTGADLGGTTDVRVKAGTLTMLAPAAKAQLAEHYAGLQIIPPDELREILSSNIGATIGMQDDAVLMRVRGQIAEWEEGPPEGWVAPEPQGIDPMTGEPVPGQDESLAEIFEPVPSDTLPGTAQRRLREIANAMQGSRYRRWPVEWRVGLDMEFQRMMAAAQPPMLPAGPEPGAEAPPPDKPATDLFEDAMQEGAPPELVSGAAI